MTRLIDRARLLLAVLTKGPRLGTDFLEITNRRFCNSPGKIIGWSRGYPSYYLLSPPVMSRPAMNSLTTRLMSLYQWRMLPDLAGLAVADSCNCACEHCSFTAMQAPQAPLTTTEWLRVIREAQELGVATVNFVGGEPLLRPDLTRLIRAVDPDLSQTVLFTNGLLLATRADELARAGLTSVVVSIDAPQAADHDARRAVRGCFDRAVAGVRAAQRARLLVGLSAVVRPEDVARGTLVGLFELGRELRVNQILLFDAVATGSYRGAECSRADLEDIIALSAAYQQKAGYPGIHCYAYSKSHRGIGCGGGVSHFYVAPHGAVCPCDFDPASVGNVREAPLHVLWDRFAAQGRACSSLDGCRRTKPQPAACARAV
jgi:MoaA/NifB/PqqE/SkfB family radical SAM enzyme